MKVIKKYNTRAVTILKCGHYFSLYRLINIIKVFGKTMHNILSKK